MRRLPLVLALILATASHAEDWLYLTAPGDTLIGIGRQYLKNPQDWPKVQQANKLANVKRLPANTRIKLPVALLRQTPAPASVTHVKGNARVKSADGPFRKLEVGDRLIGGETVLTGPASFVTIRLADGSLLNQQPSSKLTFGRLAAYGKTGMVASELNLEAGRLEASASKQLAPAGGFKVATPVAVAGLRGTAFRLNLSEDGKALRSEVLEGAVGVAAQGREVGVAAGQGSVTEQGKPPAPPRPLHPAPNLDGLPSRVDGLPLDFAWAAAPTATGWRAQIATDTAFHDIVLDDQFPAPRARWSTDLPDGHYVLRVRAVEADGLEGLNRDHPFELDARPLPPRVIAPAADSRVYGQQVELNWAAAAEALGYVLQLSPGPGFEREVREQRLDAVTGHALTLPPGHWHWRLASLDGQGLRHGWGETARFLVQPLPEAPRVESRIEAGQVHLAWSALSTARRYEVELGHDAALAHRMQQHRTDGTQLTLNLAPGQYWWRVRGLEADGQAGAWSVVRSLPLPPAPPQPSSPAAQERVRGLTAELGWEAVPGAQGYHVQLGPDASFAAPSIDTQVTGTGLPVRVEKAGHYHWRVAALAAGNLEGPFCAPRGLTFQPPPATPADLQAREVNNRLHVAWRGEAARYQLELARDQGFTQDVRRFDSVQPRQDLILPQPGQYWLRVTALDRDDVASSPSAPLAVEIRQPLPWWLLPLLILIP